MHKGERIFFHSSCSYPHISEVYFHNSFWFFCRPNYLLSHYLQDVILDLCPLLVFSSSDAHHVFLVCNTQGLHTLNRKNMTYVLHDIPAIRLLLTSGIRRQRDVNHSHSDQGRYCKTKHFCDLYPIKPFSFWTPFIFLNICLNTHRRWMQLWTQRQL